MTPAALDVVAGGAVPEPEALGVVLGAPPEEAGAEVELLFMAAAWNAAKDFAAVGFTAKTIPCWQ